VRKDVQRLGPRLIGPALIPTFKVRARPAVHGCKPQGPTFTGMSARAVARQLVKTLASSDMANAYSMSLFPFSPRPAQAQRTSFFFSGNDFPMRPLTESARLPPGLCSNPLSSFCRWLVASFLILPASDRACGSVLWPGTPAAAASSSARNPWPSASRACGRGVSEEAANFKVEAQDCKRTEKEATTAQEIQSKKIVHR